MSESNTTAINNAPTPIKSNTTPIDTTVTFLLPPDRASLSDTAHTQCLLFDGILFFGTSYAVWNSRQNGGGQRGLIVVVLLVLIVSALFRNNRLIWSDAMHTRHLLMIVAGLIAGVCTSKEQVAAS